MIAADRLEATGDRASGRAPKVRLVILLAGLSTLVATVLSSWAVTRMVRRPIGAILATMRSVRADDLTNRIGSRRRDELGGLAREIDATVELLQRTTVSVDELKSSEAELHEAHGLLAQRALFDTLTGLPNRASLMERLADALNAKPTDARSVALLFVDLDRFKYVNDTLGHAAGDEVLAEAARRLMGCVRTTDTVARLGGDEFVVVCERADIAMIDQIAERILQAFERTFFVTGGEARVTASVGVAFAEPSHDADALLAAADVALYHSKEAGRGVIHRFDHTMRAEIDDRNQVETRLGGAIDDGELRVFYQPVVRLDDRLDDRSLCGFQALVRWQHPERGLLMPVASFPWPSIPQWSAESTNGYSHRCANNCRHGTQRREAL